MRPDSFTSDERERLTELIHESLSIRTHFNLHLWLQGSLQQVLPHDILIAAWGDFSAGPIRYDVIPGLFRGGTADTGSDDLTGFLSRLFSHWESKGRTPALLGAGECIALSGEPVSNAVSRNFGGMQSILVHAIKDFRGRNDCLYVLLSRQPLHGGRTCTMFEALLPHIDASLRKIPHPEVPHAPPVMKQSEPAPGHYAGITPREAEIMRLVCAGKTNVEIGMILGVSVFTVKNHLQHIFRKLDVNNRAQAVSKF